LKEILDNFLHFLFVFIATDSIQQKSYLFSNWLQKDVDGYKLRFNIFSDTFEIFKMEVFAFDEQMKSTLLEEITDAPQVRYFDLWSINILFHILFDLLRLESCGNSYRKNGYLFQNSFCCRI
jgi:hypothetical protein